MAVELTLPTISPQAMTLESVGPITLVLGSVLNIAPTITTNPTISGTAKVGETLTATAGDTTGTPPPTSTLQWQRSDNGTSGWSDISGATGTTYVLVSADESKYLRVEQTATNIEGSATATSASTSQVQPAFTGLLDTYSGAAAAYSLRLLRTDYEGSAIRVRRSDDNEEQNIGFRNFELDTSTLESFSLGSDCFVVTWYDQSENANNATQTTAANQPKIVSSGTTILENGKPAIQFDGSDDRFTTSLAGSSIFDFYSVITATSGDDFILPDNYNFITTYYGYIARSDTSTTIYKNYGTPSLYVNGALETPTTRSDVKDLLSTGNQLLNVHQGADTSVWSYIEMFGRQGFEFSGVSQEIIIWTTDQSTNRTGIQSNINDFYSIY